jgi:hypothetical protein
VAPQGTPRLVSAARQSLRKRLRHTLLYVGYATRPKFLIIGAQKAGTTALFSYLSKHPGAVGSETKELGFFCPEVFVEWPTHPHNRVLCEGSDWDCPQASRRRRAWYHEHFPLPHRLHGRLAFEATPEYLYVPRAPRRIHSYDPEMKLIALLREPAERAYAAWTMYANWGSYRPHVYAPRRETRSFADAVDAELGQLADGVAILEPGYVRRGLYAEQIERYFECFRREQLLVLDSARLASDTSTVVNEAAAFLGLPALPARTWPRVHVGSYGEVEASVDAVLTRLRGFYAPHNERLLGLVDDPPPWAYRGENSIPRAGQNPSISG